MRLRVHALGLDAHRQGREEADGSGVRSEARRTSTRGAAHTSRMLLLAAMAALLPSTGGFPATCAPMLCVKPSPGSFPATSGSACSLTGSLSRGPQEVVFGVGLSPRRWYSVGGFPSLAGSLSRGTPPARAGHAASSVRAAFNVGTEMPWERKRFSDGSVVGSGWGRGGGGTRIFGGLGLAREHEKVFCLGLSRMRSRGKEGGDEEEEEEKRRQSGERGSAETTRGEKGERGEGERSGQTSRGAKQALRRQADLGSNRPSSPLGSSRRSTNSTATMVRGGAPPTPISAKSTTTLSAITVMSEQEAAEKKEIIRKKAEKDKSAPPKAKALDGDGKYLSSLYRYTDDGRDLSGPSRYRDDYWVTSLLTLMRSRVFQRIWPHLTVNMIIAASVSVLYFFIPSIPPLPGLIHAVTGSFLGLLIAFRTQASLHPTPYTRHPTPYTPHPTPYTLHPTPDALNTRPKTPNPKPQTPNPKP
jgi:hypothetical protein